MIQTRIARRFLRNIRRDRLIRAAREALAQQNAPEDASLTIVVSGNEELRRLNRRFLGLNAPTDVLSFPAEEANPDNQERYLGDVVISFPMAQAQAEAAGHSCEDELELLVVHGVLHLLGHDHAEPQEKKRMWAAQAEILARLNNPAAAPE
jgi:probable rRNA maturation factor